MYRKKLSPYYYPNIVEIQIGDYLSDINYSEIVDESCVEFSMVHDDYEVYYCLEGSMHLMINEQYVNLEANHFAVIKPGTNHYTVYEPSQKKKYFIFIFETPVLNSARKKTAECSGTNQLIKEGINYLDLENKVIFRDEYNCKNVIEKLAREMEAKKPGYEQMITSLYSEFLVNIFRNFNVSKEEKTQGKDIKNVEQINLALELTQYMHEHYNQDIKVKDAAEYFHISERHLSRIFEKYFGKSFKHTLNVYRVNYAKNYLVDTNYSLEKIAELVGISSTKMFHRLFKEMENMTPTEYREKHRK